MKDGDVVRVKTDKGFQKKAVVEKMLSEPRSYLVNSNGTLIRRNRNHLLKTSETVNTSNITAASDQVERIATSKQKDTESNKVLMTRYGRLVRI